jgi:hypothetical protein
VTLARVINKILLINLAAMPKKCARLFQLTLSNGTELFTIQEEQSLMPVYTVERSLLGIQMDQLAAVQEAAIETSEKFTAEGKDVRYLRTTFVPGEAHCMCVF